MNLSASHCIAPLILGVAVTGCTSPDAHLDRNVFSVAFSNPKFRVEEEERTQASDRDYPSVLQRAAAKDERALRRLFHISAESRWSASGSEFHRGTMRRLLLVWGDADFAGVLAQQTVAVRQHILHVLSAHEDPAIPHLFPRTYAAGTATR